MFIWILATFVAFFIKGLCGFANALIFSAILSFALNNINITPVELILGSPTNLIVVWHERKYLKWNICLPLSGIVLLGNIPGILFLKTGTPHTLKILFGIIVIAIGIEMLIRESCQRKAQESKVVLAIIGLTSGILCGLYGIGALIGAYIGRCTSNSHEFKANICFCFMVEGAFRLIMYIIYGIITMDTLIQALWLYPVMLFALGCGIYSCRWLNDKFIKKIVIIMLIFAGITLIVNNL